MAIGVNTPGIHHISLRCTDISRTKSFYHETLGFPLLLDRPDLVGIMIGSVFVGFRLASPKHPDDTAFNPMNIGMDHLAMACEDENELQRVADALTEKGIENTGIKTDTLLNKKYVAFKDPDRIQWELYMT